MRLVVLSVSILLLLAPVAAVAQSAADGAGAGFPAAEEALPSLTPSGDDAAERPRLHKPLVPPKGPKPVLGTNRAPDAATGRRGVRLELWVPQQPVKAGKWLPATLRITNLSGRPIRHYGQAGCDNGNVGLSFDYSSLFEPGLEWSGKAARFKWLFLRGYLSNTMYVAKPVRSDYLGGVGTDEIIPAGHSVVVSKVAFVNYSMASQPLPSGVAAVEGCFRFEFAGKPNKHYDECLSAPVKIKGRKVHYPSPYELVDAMLSEPAFHAWVESCYPHAQFHTGMGGPVKNNLFFDRWDELGYSGGPAPEEVRKAYAMGGGPNDDWVRDLLIDVWTAEVLGMDVVSGTDDPPVGEYQAPSPALSESELPSPSPAP